MKKKIISILLIISIIIATLPLSGCEMKNDNKYEIDIILNTESKVFSAIQKTTYTHQSETETSEVCFNIYASSTRQGASKTAVPKEMKFMAYPNGISHGEMNIKAVKIGENQANFDLAGEDENFLIVKLETPLQKGDSVEITMQYEVKLANLNSRLGYGEDTINLGNFYPILAVFEEDEGKFYECVPYSIGDPFYSETASYDVSITLPSEYLVASSGEETKTEKIGSDKKITYQADNIRSFCMVCSDKFSIQTQVKNGIEINYYYLNDNSPTLTTGLIAEVLDEYETSFGKYQYGTFAVADSNFFQGGMEYSALVMISTNTESDYRKVVIAHETAHQWWETMVGTNEIENAVLDEGLAEFSTCYFFEKNPEYGVDFSKYLANKNVTYNTYLEILNVLGEKTPPTIAQSLANYKSSYDYYALVYVGGHLIFEKLRGEIGEENFIKFLNDFKEEYQNKNATINDLIDFAKYKMDDEFANAMKNLFFPI